MGIALVALIAVISAIPAMLIIDDPLAPLIVGAVAAFAVVAIAISANEKEIADLRAALHPIAWVAIAPAVWMLLQALPNPWWEHPVWRSAATLLEESRMGALSMDPGLTLRACYDYGLAVAIAFAATAVAVIPWRAKLILVALTNATTFVALILLIQWLLPTDLLKALDNPNARDAALGCVAFGAVVAAAMAVVAVDPYERRQREDARPYPEYSLIIGLAASAICVATVLLFGTGQVIVATLLGLAMLLASIGARWAGGGAWAGAGIAIAAMMAVALIGMQAWVPSHDIAIAFAPEDNRHSVLSVTNRILGDAAWTGTGAGTFGAIARIYNDRGDMVGDVVAPTFAAALSVELGRPALLLVLLAAIATMLLLIQGALLRVRDSTYPAAAASCVATSIVLGFSGVSLLSTTTSIALAIVLGAGIAQRRSRSRR